MERQKLELDHERAQKLLSLVKQIDSIKTPESRSRVKRILEKSMKALEVEPPAALEQISGRRADD
jgi:hypothetical protein